MIVWFSAQFNLSLMSEKLPLDIIVLVLSFLPLKDLRNVSLSCKKFSQITKNEKLWRIKFNSVPSENKNWLSEEQQKLSFFEKFKLVVNPFSSTYRPIENNIFHYGGHQPSRQTIHNPIMRYQPQRIAFNPPPMRMPHNPPPMRMPHHHPLMRHQPMRMPHNPLPHNPLPHMPPPHMRMPHNPPPMRMPHHHPLMRHQPMRMPHNPLPHMPLPHMPPHMRMPYNPPHIPHLLVHHQPQRTTQSRQVINSNQVYSPVLKSMNEDKPHICWIF